MKHIRLFGIASLLLIGCLWLPGCAPREATSPEKAQGLELVILHTNDTHAHVAGIDAYGNAAFDQRTSRGGLARIAAAIRDAKAKNDNVIALDAGDQFQGTLFYSVNKWPMQAALNQHLPFDAMTLGNHEFDEGCLELAHFLKETPFPVLAANLAPTKGCPLLKARYAPWLIVQIRERKVGIVGLANDEARELARACPQTGFEEAAASLSQAVRELEKRGVRHIVALTHLGLPADRRLARSVDGVDIIVGGHTHSYLGKDSAEGPYPIVEHSPGGQPVLVVTAKRAAQYLGELRVRFDARGVPHEWEGGPRELAPNAPLDAATATLVDSYAAALEGYRSAVVGSHTLRLPDGMDACRSGDCLGGMVTADAMLEYARPYGAVMALCNGGGIRAALPAGDISRGHLLAMLPFGNILVLRDYSGEQLRQALEHGAGQEGAKGPRLLQAAGLRYVIDDSRPAGQRIVKGEVIDAQGKAVPLDPNMRYGVILPDYMARGGDGYAMLGGGQPLPSPEPLDVDIVEAYIRNHSPLPMPITGRITRTGFH